eukprot:GCRY01001830.1.p1 GENE.GCRY01001830.1~~GCRY01001830.1.p1  ORF type:complete len:405 (-),score=35.89 GCRY01001830.1:21-1235(-)
MMEDKASSEHDSLLGVENGRTYSTSQPSCPPEYSIPNSTSSQYSAPVGTTLSEPGFDDGLPSYEHAIGQQLHPDNPQFSGAVPKGSGGWDDLQATQGSAFKLEKSVRSDKYLGSFLLNVATLAFLVIPGSLFPDVSFKWIMFTFFFILYLVNCFSCSTHRFLRHVMPYSHVVGHINQLKSVPPKIYHHIECYHYRTHTVRQGNQTKQERKKVVTYVGEEVFPFSNWQDLSPSAPFEALKTHSMVLVSFYKDFCFADALTERLFRLQGQSFVDRNRRRDTYFDYRTSMALDGFEPKILSFSESGVGWSVSLWAFWLSSLLFLSWPYRIYIGCIAYSYKYCFVTELRGAVMAVDGSPDSNIFNPNSYPAPPTHPSPHHHHGRHGRSPRNPEPTALMGANISDATVM